MTLLTGKANAKLNLTLDVVGCRRDGYHDLKMVMQEIDLGDTVTLTLGTGEGWKVTCDSGEIPCDDTNLAVKAAKLFFGETGIDPEGMTFHIEKRTPVCAGMGGGSSDGAAVLRLLNDYYDHPVSQEVLYRLAEQTGSDVPFALFGGTALAEGKGQILTRLPAMPQCYIVLCKPNFPISTPALFRAIDSEEILQRPDTENMIKALSCGDVEAVAACLYNVFEPVVRREHEEIAEIKNIMLSGGALNACMTGSGPTVFGVFADKNQAEACYRALKTQYADTYLTNPV